MKLINQFTNFLVLGLAVAQDTAAMPAEQRQDSISNSTSIDPMLQLSSDIDFHYEILRALGLAPYGGSDIGEVLIAAKEIIPGNMESYSAAFNRLADRVYTTSQAINATRFPVSVRDGMFRAASYYRSADFFLHGNWSDPRINSLWDKQTAAFNTALALFPSPGKRITFPTANGFDVISIFYSCGLPGKRPTIIIGNGYDGAQEEMYHVQVQAVLQRGMHAITYEGPGQPTVRRQQDLGFIPEWERVVSPVVDYLHTRDDVDSAAIGLMGYSLGGQLAARAAAFEHRLAGFISLPGVYDFGNITMGGFPEEVQDLVAAGNATAVNAIVDEYVLQNPAVGTEAKWAIQQGMWSFNMPTPYEFLRAAKAYSLEGVVQQIKTPGFIGENENDLFFWGQGEILASELGRLATYHLFTNLEGAGEHCSVGAAVLQNQVALDWFQGLVSGC